MSSSGHRRNEDGRFGIRGDTSRPTVAVGNCIAQRTISKKIKSMRCTYKDIE